MKACPFLFVLLLAGCSQTPKPHIYARQGTIGAPTECCESETTAEQGIRDAEYDLAEKEFHIIRYDMPGIRTGGWDEYYASYEEFGINEHSSLFETLEYCKAYNTVMDRALEEKFGRCYLPRRDKILPPKGAKKFDYDAQRRESEELRNPGK